MCHVPYVTCHMSHVRCHLILVLIFIEVIKTDVGFHRDSRKYCNTEDTVNMNSQIKLVSPKIPLYQWLMCCVHCTGLAPL